MLIKRVVRPFGSVERLKDFINKNRTRKIQPVSETIEGCLLVGPPPMKKARYPGTSVYQATWPSHNVIVDKQWDNVVDDLVSVSNGKIEASALSKPDSPTESLLACFWHYPTKAIKVLV